MLFVESSSRTGSTPELFSSVSSVSIACAPVQIEWVVAARTFAASNLKRQRHPNRSSVLSRERSFLVIRVDVILCLEELHSQSNSQILNEIGQFPHSRGTGRVTQTDHRRSDEWKLDLRKRN